MQCNINKGRKKRREKENGRDKCNRQKNSYPGIKSNTKNGDELSG